MCQPITFLNSSLSLDGQGLGHKKSNVDWSFLVPSNDAVIGSVCTNIVTGVYSRYETGYVVEEETHSSSHYTVVKLTSTEVISNKGCPILRKQIL